MVNVLDMALDALLFSSALYNSNSTRTSLSNSRTYRVYQRVTSKPGKSALLEADSRFYPSKEMSTESQDFHVD